MNKRPFSLKGNFFLALLLFMFIPIFLGNILVQSFIHQFQQTSLKESLKMGKDFFLDGLKTPFSRLEQGMRWLPDHPEFHEFLLQVKDPALEERIRPRRYFWEDLGIKRLRLFTKSGDLIFDSQGNLNPTPLQNSIVLFPDFGNVHTTLYHSLNGLFLNARSQLSSENGGYFMEQEIQIDTNPYFHFSRSLNIHLILSQKDSIYFTTLLDSMGKPIQDLDFLHFQDMDRSRFESATVFFQKEEYEVSLFRPPFSPYSDLDLWVLVEKPRFFSFYQSLFMGSFVFFLVFVVILTLLLRHSIISPLTRVSRSVEAFPILFRENKPFEPLEIPENQELATLAQGYNGMAAQVISYREKLSQSLTDLNEKNQTLLEVNHQKDEFLAMTSHELRTPLNGIIGLSRAVLEQSGELEKPVRHNLDLIYRSGLRLKNMVNDILDFSKLKKTTLHMNLRVQKIKPIIKLAAELAHPLIGHKPLRLHIHPGDDLWVLADEERTLQILQNLLQNAIKFTDHGDLTLGWKKEGDNIWIEVSDTGRGISPENQKLVFKAFEQETPQNIPGVSGTGLGLTITKNLVELQNGEIRLDSQLGKGTRISFSLPWVSQEEQKDSPTSLLAKLNPSKILLPGISIGLVEDEMINAMVMENYFSKTQCHYRWFHSGEELFQSIENQDFTPDIILLDLLLPGESGLDISKKLRESFPKHEMPIFLITAKDISDLLEESLSSGITEILPKPVDKGELLMKIKHHLEILGKLKNKTN